jgi:hypothetical protein
MTPEERAYKLVGAVVKELHDHEDAPLAWLQAAEKVAISAFRQAENDKLEEAAKMVYEMQFNAGVIHSRPAPVECSKAIRALKHPE